MRTTSKSGVGRRAGGLTVDRVNGTLRVAPPGTVLLFFDATMNKLRFVDEDGNLTTLRAGGGGVSVHSDLSGLSWSTGGHIGTADSLAGFNGSGAATYYQIGVDVQAYNAGLTSLATKDGVAGLPYVTSAETWNTATLGDLAVSGGAWQVTKARGLLEAGGTTLTMGAVADARLLARNGTDIGGVQVSTGLSMAAGALSVDTSTIATLAAVAAGYQPLDADLTALAALASTGIMARTAANTYALRTLQGGAGVTISNGDGVSGNPTISFAGGTGQDDDPTTAYTISITPSNATLFSRDGGITVRSASAGNLATRRATNLTGAFADFYTTNMNVFQTRWSYSGSASIRVRWVTGSSVAATCRYKFGFTGGGLTSTDAETALRDTVMFRYVTGLGHTKWMAYSQNASGSEETDTGITVSANTEYLLEIQLNATQAVFYINGVSVATHSTYKPSSSQDLGFQGGVYATGKTIYVVGARFNLTWS
jgi:hypothetical protein